MSSETDKKCFWRNITPWVQTGAWYLRPIYGTVGMNGVEFFIADFMVIPCCWWDQWSLTSLSGGSVGSYLVVGSSVGFYLAVGELGRFLMCCWLAR